MNGFVSQLGGLPQVLWSNLAGTVQVRARKIIVSTNLTLVDNGDSTATLTASGGGGGGAATSITATISNTTGSAIPALTAVMWNDTASSGAPEVWVPGSSDSSSYENGFLGITTSLIANGATGDVLCFGVLTGVNTSGWGVGNDVHIGASGALASGGGNIWVGIVLTDAVSGSIFVAGTAATNMGPPLVHHHAGNNDGGATLSHPKINDYLPMTEVTAGSVPSAAASTQNLFVDSADHKLKRKDSGGTVTIIG